MPRESVDHPNVIWIFGDQHRAQALGCMGDPNVHTPNIDRLAAEGLTFTHAVSGFPLCCPFRGSLLTGRYPHHCVPGHEYQMPPEQPTIAHRLQRARATTRPTSASGTWTASTRASGRAGLHIVPPERRGGFDDWIGYENNNSQWDCWVHGGEGDDAVPVSPARLRDRRADRSAHRLPATQRGAEQAAGRTPALLRRALRPAAARSLRRACRVDGSPHAGRAGTAPERAGRAARRRTRRGASWPGYYAQIENLDWNVGRIREALAENGLTENTHIVFFSDHGDMHGSHGQFRKTSPWEESIRIPFIVGGHIPRYANRAGASMRPSTTWTSRRRRWACAASTCPLDGRAPTTPGIASATGRSCDAPDSAYLQLVVPTRHGDSVDRPWRGVITRDGWKYVVLEGQPWLMFNLNEDPYEQVNLAHNTRFAKQRRVLHERLARWIEETGDEFALPML